MIDSLPKAKKIYLIKQNKIIDYELMKQLHEEKDYDISFMCMELGISRAAYYKWLNKKPCARQRENEELINIIKEVSSSNNSLFGSQTMTYYIRNEYKLTYNHKRIYRLMCINNISSSYRRKPSYNYRRSTPEVIAENILNRNFDADKPNEKWCTDITEIKIPTTNDKLYISPVLDLYDRNPVALCVSERNDTILTDEVLRQAHKAYPEAKPIYHSDRGFQYTRTVFKRELESYGMTQSMSRVSKCIDNGPCEQFQGQFKDILFTLFPNITTKQDMVTAIYKTLDYYINHYPQKRFKGKTAGQVRKQALEAEEPTAYPIPSNPKIIKYWNYIEQLKNRSSVQTK